MPTPTIDLQPYKGVTTNWFHENVTAEDIAKNLAIEYNIVLHSSYDSTETFGKVRRFWSLNRSAL